MITALIPELYDPTQPLLVGAADDPDTWPLDTFFLMDSLQRRLSCAEYQTLLPVEYVPRRMCVVDIKSQ